MPDPIDIRGLWEGAFQYTSSADAGDFPFKAKIIQKDGAISGLIMEDNVAHGGTVKAEIEGTLSGQTVRFTKTYLHASEQYRNAVEYSGMINAEGSEISGIWKLPHDGGTFVMARKPL